MDNAKIHAYPELQEAIHQCDARILFIPLYCSHLNIIEPCFELLKRWLQMHANLMFHLNPDRVLNRAMRSCTRREGTGCSGTFSHCGYMAAGIRDQAFDDCRAELEKHRLQNITRD
ncbi:Transposase [Phytophthora megakarya]|uniref:Transposase n=1 Tax=Phytophthora megakarya TaxID=4795 RepID=A0A225VBQ8_9STRA|nr:Transposase [Phytophthora megakarya]